MAGGHTRSTHGNDNAGPSSSDSVEARFNQLMLAFVASQEAQVQNQAKQRERERELLGYFLKENMLVMSYTSGLLL